MPDDIACPSTESCIARRSILKAGLGEATAVSAFAALSGTAAAHFPKGLEIDIKQGSEDNPINPNSNSFVPVAVFQPDEFDPTSENVNYRFGAPEPVKDGGGARPAHDGHIEDVDGDGDDDLVLHFPAAETGFDGDEERGRLEWERGHREAEHGLSGTDNVTIIGSGR